MVTKRCGLSQIYVKINQTVIINRLMLKQIRLLLALRVWL